jgi:hypothetical protein
MFWAQQQAQKAWELSSSKNARMRQLVQILSALILKVRKQTHFNEV